MPGIIQIPIIRNDASLRDHPLIERRGWVRGQYVKRSRLNSVLDGPFDRPVKDRFVVAIHAEYDAAVNHHSRTLKPAYGLTVVAIQVLVLALFKKVVLIERLEADKQAAEPARYSLL